MTTTYIHIYIYTDTNPITLEKWFPLQGELASLKKKCSILLLIINQY